MNTSTYDPTASTVPVGRPPTLLALCAVVTVCLVGYVTLGRSGVIAGARSAVVTGVQALLGHRVGAVHSGPVEDVVNALLFVPVGALGCLALARRGRLLSLLVGTGLSAAVELAQFLWPGRVPDRMDVAMNAAGNALGVGLVALEQALSRWRRPRAARGGRLPACLLALPVLVALTACQPTETAGDQPRPVSVSSATVAPVPPVGTPGRRVTPTPAAAG